MLNAQHAYQSLVVDGKDWVSVYLRETQTFHFENGRIVGSDRTEDYGEMHEVLQGDTVIDGHTSATTFIEALDSLIGSKGVFDVSYDTTTGESPER